MLPSEEVFVHPYYFHGTTMRGISELRANPVVYLTPNRAYALFYIIDKSINWVTCAVKENGVVHYDEHFPEQLKKLYRKKSGYLYRCNGTATLIPGKSRDIVVSQSPVEVADYEYIPDIYQEILHYEKAGAIIIKRYGGLLEDEKKDIFDMIVHYIFKNDLLTVNGPKAVFIRDSFPGAWNYAMTHVADKYLIMKNWQVKMEKGK